MTADGEPRAVLVLVVGHEEHVLARLPPATRCDLRLLDQILRLRLMATRCGWSLRLTDVDADLADLVALAGLTELLAT